MKEFGKLWFKALCVLTSIKTPLIGVAELAALASPVLWIAFSKDSAFSKIP